MSILIVLIICSILVAAIFLIAFVVSVRNGQFDDTYSPGHRILFDDNVPLGKQKSDKSFEK